MDLDRAGIELEEHGGGSRSSNWWVLLSREELSSGWPLWGVQNSLVDRVTSSVFLAQI